MAADEKAKAAAYGKVISTGWRDLSYTPKTLAELQGASVEAGVAVPPGETVKAVENTDKHVHLVLPPKPPGELSDEALEKVAAAGVVQIVGIVG